MAASMANLSEWARRTQFSLRGLLLLTTATAVVLAGRPWLGTGHFVLLLIMLVALANYLGMFGWLQHRWVAQPTLYLAGAIFAVSLFMHVTKGYSGWKMALGTAKACYLVFSRLDLTQSWQAIIWELATWPLLVVSTISNAALLLSPVLAHRLAQGTANWLRTALALAPIAAWSWLCWMLGSYLEWEAYLHTGYYVWCIAISLTLPVLPLTRGQFLAMAALSAWMIVASAWLFNTNGFWAVLSMR